MSKNNGQPSHSRNRDLLESLKTNCVKCGDDRPWVIEFHHMKPSEKSFIVSLCASKGKSALLNEAQKCVCLCANCHKEFHFFFGRTPCDPIGSFEDFLNEDY